VKQSKSRQLREAGWRVGNAREFLSLTDAEAALIEMRIVLGRHLRVRRLEGGLSQTELATRMGSSQSRIAKMESADPSVSLDLLIRSLLSLGVSSAEIGKALRG
jgi:ribosome-binding protein aMBF1 (putative translation factor)